MLEVVAVLRRHVSDDTYRFEPARDFTGRNVYRSSLLRLENLESLYAEALRAGHMDGVIAFAKGRALERLRAFDLAADAYRLAVERDAELAADALRSAELCDALDLAVKLTTDLEAPTDAAVLYADPGAAITRFDDRLAALEDLERSVDGTHHAVVIREEIERCDMDRAAYFLGLRKVLPDGDVRAAAELQRVVMRHLDSKHASRHLLALAEFYADLAAEYVDAHPPESLTFDPARFQELSDSATRLYEMVATRDGTPEKLEASRQLEAFLAFALRIDRDRFTP
jgi:tetratricopeptide (TPR) repeat protein